MKWLVVALVGAQMLGLLGGLVYWQNEKQASLQRAHDHAQHLSTMVAHILRQQHRQWAHFLNGPGDKLPEGLQSLAFLTRTNSAQRDDAGLTQRDDEGLAQRDDAGLTRRDDEGLTQRTQRDSTKRAHWQVLHRYGRPLSDRFLTQLPKSISGEAQVFWPQHKTLSNKVDKAPQAQARAQAQIQAQTQAQAQTPTQAAMRGAGVRVHFFSPLEVGSSLEGLVVAVVRDDPQQRWSLLPQAAAAACRNLGDADKACQDGGLPHARVAAAACRNLGDGDTACQSGALLRANRAHQLLINQQGQFSAQMASAPQLLALKPWLKKHKGLSFSRWEANTAQAYYRVEGSNLYALAQNEGPMAALPWLASGLAFISLLGLVFLFRLASRPLAFRQASTKSQPLKEGQPLREGQPLKEGQPSAEGRPLVHGRSKSKEPSAKGGALAPSAPQWGHDEWLNYLVQWRHMLLLCVGHLKNRKQFDFVLEQLTHQGRSLEHHIQSLTFQNHNVQPCFVKSILLECVLPYRTYWMENNIHFQQNFESEGSVRLVPAVLEKLFKHVLEFLKFCLQHNGHPVLRPNDKNHSREFNRLAVHIFVQNQQVRVQWSVPRLNIHQLVKSLKSFPPSSQSQAHLALERLQRAGKLLRTQGGQLSVSHDGFLFLTLPEYLGANEDRDMPTLPTPDQLEERLNI